MDPYKPIDPSTFPSLTNVELREICANPIRDVGLQIAAAQELTNRAIARAAKPHWSIVPMFWLVVLGVIISLAQWGWSAHNKQQPIAPPVVASPLPPTDTKPANPIAPPLRQLPQARPNTTASPTSQHPSTPPK